MYIQEAQLSHAQGPRDVTLYVRYGS